MEERTEMNQTDFTENGKRGRLKIFFGCAAGAGKTYSMLEAGQQARKKGVDVVVGYLEEHDRPETLAQAKGLEWLPPAVLKQGPVRLKEMDLDAVLERKPALALVDEMAHTNASDCRHLKRYQDIQELLVNGIDVYTTLNVQHLESLNDLVASITGIHVSERIPDDLFDLADQVELVDIEPDDLLERLAEGKVYHPDQAKLARDNFFTPENLMALREIALRRCADRSGRHQAVSGPRDHILVCLSSSPSNARIIRSAARMAQAFDGRFTALYVETPDSGDMSESNQNRLQENMRLANRLGADIQSVYGENIAGQIGEYARVCHVSKIVIGRQGIRSAFAGQVPLAEKLSEAAPDAEIFIIPDPDEEGARMQRKRSDARKKLRLSFGHLLKLVLIGVSACLAAWLASSLGFSETSLLAIFVFAIILQAMLSRTLAEAALSSAVSLLLFAYFFAEPAFSLDLIDQGYLIAFLILVLCSVMTARISIRQKNAAEISARSAAQASMLFEAGQNLQEMDDDEKLGAFITRQVADFLNRKTVFYPIKNGSLGKPIYSAEPGVFSSQKEKAVALWTLKNNKRAGASTDTLSAARTLCLAIRHRGQVYGVLGIDLEGRTLSADQNTLLLSLLGQAALAMENEKIAREKEENAVLARQQQIRASLLRSISHDLRTPLTTISGSADLLLHQDPNEKTRKQLEKTIYEDAVWLRDTVENLLSLSRMEEGSLQLNLEVLDIEEVIEEALKHASPKKNEHPIQVSVEGLCLSRLDGKLAVSMMINLINNALQYTEPGTPIEISARIDGDSLDLAVADRGRGIGKKQAEHLFEPFAIGHTKISDACRSMGLGLSLVKNVVDIHHGTIEYKDNRPGARFEIRLPADMMNSN